MIGNNIKKWRELRDLKQSELAELLGVSDKTVSSWEINRTEPKMGMVERICSALNCKKTDIIGEDTYRPILTNDYLYINDKGDRVLIEVYNSSDRKRLIEYAKKLKELRDFENMED